MADLSNIATLPRRPASRRRKPAGASRPCQVLQFTGTKRFVYDRGEVLEKWKTTMENCVRELLVDVVKGKVTGLMIIATEGGPDDDAEASVGGVFYEDNEMMARLVAEFSELVAERIAQEEHHG